MGGFGEVFVAELTFGLQAFQFGEVALEVALGVVAGSVDGVLGWAGDGVDCLVECLSQCGFDEITAAETPGSTGDFGSEGGFEGADGREVCLERGGEFLPGFIFIGADEGGLAEESGGGGILGGMLFAGFGAGAGGGLGVFLVGCDLGWCGHGYSLNPGAMKISMGCQGFSYRSTLKILEIKDFTAENGRVTGASMTCEIWEDGSPWPGQPIMPETLTAARVSIPE